MPSVFRNFHFVRKLHTKEFTVQKATPGDRKEILRLMLDIFYKTDPSSVYSKVSENPKISPAVQETSMESLEENLSFIAKESKNAKTIIGAAINGVRASVLPTNFMDPLLKKVKSKNERTLLELWKFISTMPPDSDKYFKDAKDVFEIRYLVVDPNHRNRGIATTLVNNSIKEAVAKGHKYVRIDCTSHFSARIASAAGMDRIFEINYVDYKSPSGEQVFQNIVFPHDKVVVFARKTS